MAACVREPPLLLHLKEKYNELPLIDLDKESNEYEVNFVFNAFTNLPPKVQQEWRNHFYNDDLPMEDDPELPQQERQGRGREPAEAEAVRKPFGWGACLGAGISVDE